MKVSMRSDPEGKVTIHYTVLPHNPDIWIRWIRIWNYS